MIFSQTSRNLIMLGSLGGLLSIVLGAFGAHAVKAWLATDLMAVYQTAVSYQMYHSLGLILIGLIYHHHQSRLIKSAGWLMLSGMIIFSGSLYLLSLAGIRWLGMITPVGGICLIIAWLFLLMGISKKAS
ncbi:MAG: DUF423 domain-containing protein [Gammaproteobacteria bacterium]|nr:DUF423 domain-containing protein [Gammaproteobacteria bacterium]